MDHKDSYKMGEKAKKILTAYEKTSLAERSQKALAGQQRDPALIREDMARMDIRGGLQEEARKEASRRAMNHIQANGQSMSSYIQNKAAKIFDPLEDLRNQVLSFKLVI